MEGSTASTTKCDQIEMEGLPKMEERVCPLCSARIKLFFINYHEKLLMCENTQCEFPFGYEDLQYVRVDNPDNESGSIKTRQNFSTYSSASGITISDMEQLYQACDLENNTSEKTSVGQPTSLNQSDMLKNATPLKNIYSEIIKVNSEMKISDLTDKKLLTNLYKLQNSSGAQLLKPHELSVLQMGQHKKHSEVKIDINTTGNDISVINIELLNPEDTSDALS